MSNLWKWVKTDVLPLTREVAEQIAELPHFEGDRPWDSKEGRRRMQWLSRLVDDGKFYPPRWATAEHAGVVYRVNGGTSSHMLVSRNGSFPAGLQVIIDRFACDTTTGVADLFDQFDHRKSIRTLVQKVRAHKPAEDTLRDVSPTDINIMLSGIAASLSDFGRVEEDAKIGLIHQYPSFIAWACPFARKRHLRLKGVMAAIFAAYNRDAIYARGFWSEVADESNASNVHPTRVLAACLRTQIGIRDKQKFSARDVYVKCCHAWNAARRGKTTALKLYPREGLPPLT